MLENAPRRVCLNIAHNTRFLLTNASRGKLLWSSPVERLSVTSTWRPRLESESQSRFLWPLCFAQRPFVRSYVSRSLFALDVRLHATTSTVATTCRPSAAEKGRQPCIILRQWKHSEILAQVVWYRRIHIPTNERIVGDDKSKAFNGHHQTDKELHKEPTSKPGAYPSSDSSNTGNTAGTGSSRTGQNILQRLPHVPHLHRPSREELLAAATGFWSRQKIRFKWFSIRSLRPFNTDDISAFFSWFLVGHVIWILLGTTTFFSLAILTVNTVVAQETLARWVGNYLTKSSGIKVVFESAIVPKWRDGVITFRNVFVSRRPGQGSSHVSKGSQVTAVAAAAAAVKAEGSSETRGALAEIDGAEEENNFTQFDLTLDTVNVTLSFAKWFNGKGLLRDVEVKGIRGVVDRTGVHYNGEPVDPRSFKHEHHLGDFEINSFRLDDLLVTVHQPGNFRPFSVSIFSCELPRLRKQWLFYDFLSANTMSGSFDESLFTIHPRQIHGHTGANLDDLKAAGEPNSWKKQSRLRLDGLNIEHLNRGVRGPFSWIYEGSIDIVADIMFPADNDESIAKVMSDVYDRVEATVTSNRHPEHWGDLINRPRSEARSDEPMESTQDVRSGDDQRFVVMDLRVHLNNVRATVPLFTKDISYVNNAMIRPIVAYINSKNAFIPINCRLVKRASDFDGSWTIFDSGLMEDLSAETYEAFTRDIVDDQARRRRFKKVGLWSLQVAVQALFMGLAGSIA